MESTGTEATTIDRGRAVRTHERDFPAYFTATWPRMYRTALAITGDPAGAEDACQAAFAKAYAAWSRVCAAEHPDAYVRRMVVNEVLGTRRSAWWRRERPHADVGEPPPQPSARGRRGRPEHPVGRRRRAPAAAACRDRAALLRGPQRGADRRRARAAPAGR